MTEDLEDVYRAAIWYGDNGLEWGEAQQFDAWLNAQKAKAWTEGAKAASPYGGAYLRSIEIQNPYMA